MVIHEKLRKQITVFQGFLPENIFNSYNEEQICHHKRL